MGRCTDRGTGAQTLFCNGRMTRVLVLCTGNYFRSRFSEALLRDLTRNVPGIEVSSAGLQVNPASGNVGAMAPEALDALQQRGISLDPATLPMPRQVGEGDLQAADVVVAVDAQTHRPMVQDRFPAWESRIRFWAVKDLGEDEGSDPIALLEQQVRDLAAELTR